MTVCQWAIDEWMGRNTGSDGASFRGDRFARRCVLGGTLTVNECAAHAGSLAGGAEDRALGARPVRIGGGGV